MHDYKNIHVLISLIVKQIFKIDNSIEQKDLDDNVSRYLPVALDICFHNLIKYFVPLEKIENNVKCLTPTINILSDEDLELLIQTFSIINVLLEYYIPKSG
jgi:hypothetical protein